MSTRCVVGRAGTITSPWLCSLGPSCWLSSRTGGKKRPHLTRPQVSRVLREVLPQRTWTQEELLLWLSATQERNARAKRSHIKRRLRKRRERAAGRDHRARPGGRHPGRGAAAHLHALLPCVHLTWCEGDGDRPGR